MGCVGREGKTGRKVAAFKADLLRYRAAHLSTPRPSAPGVARPEPAAGEGSVGWPVWGREGKDQAEGRGRVGEAGAGGKGGGGAGGAVQATADFVLVSPWAEERIHK
jgi:hypothetical protein